MLFVDYFLASEYTTRRLIPRADWEGAAGPFSAVRIKFEAIFRKASMVRWDDVPSSQVQLALQEDRDGQIELDNRSRPTAAPN